MAPVRRLLPLHRSLSWLLWLALLLPMAQSAATWHGYSHLDPPEAGQHDGKQAPHAAHCDLCLTAAAVTGGALIGEDSAPRLAATRHERPREAAGSVWLALPTLAYLSRAPPPAGL